MKAADLEFPDVNRYEPGRVLLDTVQAMRNAKGVRRDAAKALGISLTTLTKRLQAIREKQRALPK